MSDREYDEMSQILIEIQNLVRGAEGLVPDEESQLRTWIRRTTQLLLWVAQYLEGDIEVIGMDRVIDMIEEDKENNG